MPSTERWRKSNNYPRLQKANWPDNRSSAPGCRRGKRNTVTLSHSHTLALSIAMPRTHSSSALNEMNGEAAMATVNVTPPPVPGCLLAEIRSRNHISDLLSGAELKKKKNRKTLERRTYRINVEEGGHICATMCAGGKCFA